MVGLATTKGGVPVLQEVTRERRPVRAHTFLSEVIDEIPCLGSLRPSSRQKRISSRTAYRLLAVRSVEDHRFLRQGIEIRRDHILLAVSLKHFRSQIVGDEKQNVLGVGGRLWGRFGFLTSDEMQFPGSKCADVIGCRKQMWFFKLSVNEPQSEFWLHSWQHRVALVMLVYLVIACDFGKLASTCVASNRCKLTGLQKAV